MKKAILMVAVIAAASFTSCKKDRTCTCVTTNSNGGAAYTGIVTYTKAKKGDARSQCLSSTTLLINGSTNTTTCTLK
jgi:hypothetical protein